jgi:hypothetical protein
MTGTNHPYSQLDCSRLLWSLGRINCKGEKDGKSNQLESNTKVDNTTRRNTHNPTTRQDEYKTKTPQIQQQNNHNTKQHKQDKYKKMQGNPRQDNPNRRQN